MIEADRLIEIVGESNINFDTFSTIKELPLIYKDLLIQ